MIVIELDRLSCKLGQEDTVSGLEKRMSGRSGEDQRRQGRGERETGMGDPTFGAIGMRLPSSRKASLPIFMITAYKGLCCGDDREGDGQEKWKMQGRKQGKKD